MSSVPVPRLGFCAKREERVVRQELLLRDFGSLVRSKDRTSTCKPAPRSLANIAQHIVLLRKDAQGPLEPRKVKRLLKRRPRAIRQSAARPGPLLPPRAQPSTNGQCSTLAPHTRKQRNQRLGKASRATLCVFT